MPVSHFSSRENSRPTGWSGWARDSRDSSPNGCVLVSTQVAEQSVDIDADLLVTDLAPTGHASATYRAVVASQSGTAKQCGGPRSGFVHFRWVTTNSRRRPQRSCAQPWVRVQRSTRHTCFFARSISGRVAERSRYRELRTILEATYAEPSAAEPAAWSHLRADLERRRQATPTGPLSATNVWSMPALPDEEDIQTRFSSYPTAGLLLVRAVESWMRCAGGTICTCGWHGSEGRRSGMELRCREGHPSQPHPRLPRWAVSAALSKPPGWLTTHVPQSTAVGLLHPDGGIRWPGSEIETGLSYHADQGLIIKRCGVGAQPAGGIR